VLQEVGLVVGIHRAEQPQHRGAVHRRDQARLVFGIEIAEQLAARSGRQHAEHGADRVVGHLRQHPGEVGKVMVTRKLRDGLVLAARNGGLQRQGEVFAVHGHSPRGYRRYARESAGGHGHERRAGMRPRPAHAERSAQKPQRSLHAPCTARPGMAEPHEQ